MAKELFVVAMVFVGVFAFGAAIGFTISPLNLTKARLNYTQCVSVGAPPQNCLERYLLPQKETKP